MKLFVAVCCLVSVAHASIIAFVPAASQYHAQDALGQYSYGYSGGPSAKQEVRTADGITQGGYSYVDANNIVQSVSYVSDPVNGFRVAATNLPQQAPGPVALVASPIVSASPIILSSASVPEETPEVKAAKIAHFQAHAEAKSALASRKRRSILTVPIVYAPVVSSQYQTQDNLGQYSYGYNDGLSAKAETRSLDGTTNGGYSYVDENGIVQNVQYTADALGFRVAASNLPVGPAPLNVAAPVAVAPLVAPLTPISAPLDTPEVAAAKAEHFAAHVEARARLLHA